MNSNKEKGLGRHIVIDVRSSVIWPRPACAPASQKLVPRSAIEISGAVLGKRSTAGILILTTPLPPDYAICARLRTLIYSIR